MVIIDTRGSMKGEPLDNSCKISFSLCWLQQVEPSLNVRVVMTNSLCIEPLMVKDYAERLTSEGESMLRHVMAAGAEGLKTAEPLTSRPQPDLLLFLTDACVNSDDARWLQELRKSVAARAVYVGKRLGSDESLKKMFGENGYIKEKNTHEVGPHLARLLCISVS